MCKDLFKSADTQGVAYQQILADQSGITDKNAIIRETSIFFIANLIQISQFRLFNVYMAETLFNASISSLDRREPRRQGYLLPVQHPVPRK
jgi:vancomycin permeability regulator SanA